MSGLNLHGSEQRVSIKFSVVVRVLSVYIDRLSVEIATCWGVRQVYFARVLHLLGLITSTSAEVRSLIHIFPKTIESNFLLEFRKPFLPPCDCLNIKEVREDRVTRPYLSYEILSIGSL
jgi:hypothetical protein